MRQGERTFQKAVHFHCLIPLVFVGFFLIWGTATAGSPDALVAESTEGLPDLPAVAIIYELAQSSTFFQGCVGPCMCPVQDVGQIEGTFALLPIPSGINPTPLVPNPTLLFTRYAMTNIHWTVVNSRRIVHRIKGNGIYEIGGEVALMQRMTLFLSIDGKDSVTFDSGLVPVKFPFPDISIEVNLGKQCHDVWMNIGAEPEKVSTPPCMENGDCGLNQFCLFPEGMCSGPGVCSPKANFCPMYCLPLCGCDMKTYCNQCEAYANGVSILKSGTCQ